jgi:hypothetical protein
MRLVFRFPPALIAVLAVIAACDDNRPQQLPVAPMNVASDAISAYVAVSDANPTPGTDVTVFVRARRGSAVAPIGSFTLRLAYDSTRLRFKDAARSSHGMVLTNPAMAGVLVAAGASADGFTDDELLSATFTVMSAGALAALELNVSELNSVNFEDKNGSTRIERGLYRGAASKK